MSEDALIFAKVFDGAGGAQSFSSLEEVPNTQSIVWYHFDANQERAIDDIKHTFTSIDDSTLDAITNEDARPRTLALDEGTLIILRGINHNEGEDPEDMIAVRIWITGSKILTLRYRKSKAVMMLGTLLDKGKGPKNIGDMVTLLCSYIFNFIELSIDQYDEKVDLLEQFVVDSPDKKIRSEISNVRKAVIVLRRYIAPQKEAISQLRFSDVPWLDAKHLRRIQESQDALFRAIEKLDAIRERSQVVKDELVNALSDKLNRNLYVLSVITAIFLPLGFLTGLFGINIGGMPGVDNPEAFAYFAISLAVIVGIQIVLFKWFKWF